MKKWVRVPRHGRHLHKPQLLQDGGEFDVGTGHPRISIVIPSFNQGGFIEAALQSLISQDYPGLEIIVVDGGSEDGTREIIERHADRIAWWRSAPDRGQGHALNEGFAHATGDIIGWLCSDDLLAPGALHEIARAFTETGADLIVGRTGVVSERGTRVPWERQRWCNERDLLFTGRSWSQPATFWRRGLWQAAGGVDESLHFVMDYDLWLRFFEHAPRVHYLDRVLAFERRHGAQKTAVANLARLRAEKLGVRLRAARRRGYGRSGLLWRSFFYRRLMPMFRSSRLFHRADPAAARWTGAECGFGSGLAVVLRRWLAALCRSDADERALLREVLRRGA